MNRTTVRSIGIALGAVLVATAARAQQPAPAAPVTPHVGQMAPDFTIPGATRYGVLQHPIHLADLRGETVVIAFFIRARTKG